MKKSVIISLVFVSIISLFFTFTPNVLSQSEKVEVLSYNWYGSQFGFIVVGEVQNVGPNIIDYIYLGGIIYTTDGQAQAVSYTKVFSSQILQQQKAPFRMSFFPENSYTGDFSWLSIGIDHVEFGVVDANETDNYQYQNLEIANSMSYIDSYGLYTVTGSIRNTGNQAAGRVWVVATFYNVSGNVIGAGYTNYLTPDSILPDQTTSFTVTKIDYPPQLATQITNYALLIQTEAPIIPEFNSFLILSIFMIATLLAVIFYRRRLKKASE